jgi:hypothetical protein
MKREKLEGRDEGGTQYLSQSEVDEKIQSVKAEIKSDSRNRLIADPYETEKLTQTEIADTVGLTQPAVNQILTNRSISMINKSTKPLNNLYHAQRELENSIDISEHSPVAPIELGERGDRLARAW